MLTETAYSPKPACAPFSRDANRFPGAVGAHNHQEKSNKLIRPRAFAVVRSDAFAGNLSPPRAKAYFT